MDSGTRPIQPEVQVSSPAEMPDKNEGQPITESLSATTDTPTEPAGIDPFSDPVFVNVTDQDIGGIIIIGAGPKAK